MPHVRWWCWALPFMRCHDKPLCQRNVIDEYRWLELETWVCLINIKLKKKHYIHCSNMFWRLFTWGKGCVFGLDCCNKKISYPFAITSTAIVPVCPNHLANNYHNSSSKVSWTWSLLALIPALDIPKPWSQGNWATLKDLACRLHFSLNFYQG